MATVTELREQLEQLEADGYGDQEIYQQDCFSAPNLYTGSNVYVGTVYDNDGDFNTDEEGEAIEDQVILECF